MTVRERVLAIKLLEQQKKKPEYLKKLGVQITMNKTDTIILERRENRIV